MVIADFHIHSKYSRACSKELTIPNIARACEKKGIDLAGTGDFTHPAWLAHLEESLEEVTFGVFAPRAGVMSRGSSKTRFILSTEISCIYTQHEKVRRVHLVLLAPSFAAVRALNKALEARDCNIKSDGRPILGLSAKEVLRIITNIDPNFVMIPAHAWTPWFSVFGSKSGFDSLEECFEELTPQIFAIETGLSSDPAMNWRLSQLDNIALVSNSDAHGLENLGREANVLAGSVGEMTFAKLIGTIRARDPKQFLYTIEFFPEEGKYHYDGHRECGVVLSPRETKKVKGTCPQCKRPLTLGVLHRVDNLADRPEGADSNNRVPFKSIVPLKEVIGDALEKTKTTKAVGVIYEQLIEEVGNEFHVLLEATEEKISAASSSEIALSIKLMRAGCVHVNPGYDGVFGKIAIFDGHTRPPTPKQQSLLSM